MNMENLKDLGNVPFAKNTLQQFFIDGHGTNFQDISIVLIAIKTKYYDKFHKQHRPCGI